MGRRGRGRTKKMKESVLKKLSGSKLTHSEIEGIEGGDLGSPFKRSKGEKVTKEESTKVGLSRRFTRCGGLLNRRNRETQSKGGNPWNLIVEVISRKSREG